MDVKVPSLAENINSGTIVKIFVAEGDQVQKDQDIVELETEKAVAAIPSPVDGKVTKLHVKEGDEVQVGQVLLSLSEVAAKEEVAKEEKREDAGKLEGEKKPEEKEPSRPRQTERKKKPRDQKKRAKSHRQKKEARRMPLKPVTALRRHLLSESWPSSWGSTSPKCGVVSAAVELL